MKPKFIILFILFFLFIRCSILIDPIVESIANSFVLVENELQLDSCESNLINSTICFRFIDHEFPTRLSDLYDSLTFEKLFLVKNDTANLNMLKNDSIDFVDDFFMNYKCESVFDSIEFMPYENDSLDLFWSKHKFDSIFNKTVIDEKYRIRVQGDTIGSFDCIYYYIVMYDSLNRKIFCSTNQELNKKRRRNKK